MQFGNTNWESTDFNSRLKPTQIALGTNPNGTGLLDLVFEYGATAAAKQLQRPFSNDHSSDGR